MIAIASLFFELRITDMPSNGSSFSRHDLKKQLAEAAKGEVAGLAKALRDHEGRFQDLWDEQARINDEINALKDQLTEVAARIAAEDVPERTRLQNALAEAARDAGGKFLSDNA
jgi:chromosome segregation ATPase